MTLTRQTTGDVCEQEGEGGTPRLTVMGVTNMVLRKRKVVARCAVFGAVVMAVVTLFQPRTYTATASFVPEGNRSPSSLASLAAQFGVSLAGAGAGAAAATDGAQSFQFYADLLTSSEVLASVASRQYVVRIDDSVVQGDLQRLLKVKAETPALRREAVLKKLRHNIVATSSPKTGVVEFSVTAPYASLSRDMAQALLDEVSRFNLERRQSRATAERRFLAERLAQVRNDLLAAQNRVQVFLQANRDYARAPHLQFEYDRLNQESAMQQQVNVALTQAFEQAKLEEVRNTPVITVIESPWIPARKDSRGGVRHTILGFALGLFIGGIIALTQAWSASLRRRRDPEVEEFLALRADVASDLRRFIWRQSRA